MVWSHSYQSETPITGDKLRKGDHVYVWRSKSRYSQHGIYLGDGMIVCFTNAIPSLPWCRCPRPCAGPPNSGGSGKLCMLEWVLFQGDGSLYQYEYGVSEDEFKERRAGTCTTATSDPPDTVNDRAKYMLSHGFGRFDFLKHNCEDFALYCKTGLVVNGGRGSSSQVIPPSIFTGVGWKAFVNRWFGDGVVFHDEYRYLYDIGVREDKQRIAVQDLVTLLQGPGNSNRPTAIHIVKKMERRMRGIEGTQKIILEELKRKGNLETALMKKMNILIIIIIIMTILTTILATAMFFTRGAFPKQSNPNALPGAGPLSLL